MQIVGILLLVLLFLVAFLYCVYKSSKPGVLKNIRRVVNTLTNERKGLINKSNIRWCSFELDIQGHKDITHPSILLDNHDMMVAATPYPQLLEDGGVGFENPYLFKAVQMDNQAVTHFKLVDKEPICLPEEAHYNSDPVLFKWKDKTYLMTRKQEGPDYLSKIILQEYVGDKWSEPIDIIKTDRMSACPMVIQMDNKLKVYMINYRWNSFKGHKTIGYTTENVEIWENENDELTMFKFDRFIDWPHTQQVYHGDMFYHEGYYYMLFNGLDTSYRTFYGIHDHFKYLWIAKSKDGVHFSVSKNPLIKRSGIYKPTSYLKDGILNVYFATDNSYFGSDRKHYRSGNRIGHFSISLNSIKYEK